MHILIINFRVMHNESFKKFSCAKMKIDTPENPPEIYRAYS